ncbi:MAG TPA: FCD domain-containing protein, partial [Clostridia bacterium]|nr:FCD domain-containing protein [Clostridia bacterium]
VIYKRMEMTKDDLNMNADEDLNFHTALAVITGNRVIIKINAIMHDLLRSAMREMVNIFGYKNGLYYHKLILDAIAAHDAEQAVAVMREHIADTIEKASGLEKQRQK